MAKPQSQRQREWLDRLYLKARLFEEMNGSRRAALCEQFDAAEGDETAIGWVREFFLTHPDCTIAPLRVEFHKGTWEITFAPDAPDLSTAAARLAVAERDTDPVVVLSCDGARCTEVAEPVSVTTDLVRRRRELQDRGLWGRDI